MIAAMRDECLRYKALAEGAIGQVSDDDLTAIAADGSNSIAIICRHVSGNLASRFTDFLTSDGEKSWRYRDQEFEPGPFDRQQMLAQWNAGWSVLLATLDTLTPADLDRQVTIRQQPLTVEQALLRALAHTSYHVGQIVWLAKAARGGAWTSLSIPRGQSEAYTGALGREPPSRRIESPARVPGFTLPD